MPSPCGAAPALVRTRGPGIVHPQEGAAPGAPGGPRRSRRCGKHPRSSFTACPGHSNNNNSNNANNNTCTHYISRPGQAVKLPRGCLPHLRDLRGPPGAPGTAPIWGWTMPGPLVRTRAGAAPQGMALGPTGGSSALGRAGGRGELPGRSACASARGAPGIARGAGGPGDGIPGRSLLKPQSSGDPGAVAGWRVFDQSTSQNQK